MEGIDDDDDGVVVVVVVAVSAAVGFTSGNGLVAETVRWSFWGSFVGGSTSIRVVVDDVVVVVVVVGMVLG